MIHPNAIIDPQAELAANVTVGPFVHIEADVQVAEGSHVLTGTTLLRGTRVGRACHVGPYAIIGGLPMDYAFAGETSYVVLEDNVEVREFATIHRASGKGAETRIGRDSVIMSYAHISHNGQLGRGVTLVTQVQLAGHCQVGDYAFLSTGVGLHQYVRVGAYAMVGSRSSCLRDILPYSMAQGVPARHFRLNRVGLKRRGFDGERYTHLEHAIRAYRKHDWEKLEALAEVSAEVSRMLDFKRSSKRGVCAFVSS